MKRTYEDSENRSVFGLGVAAQGMGIFLALVILLAGVFDTGFAAGGEPIQQTGSGLPDGYTINLPLVDNNSNASQPGPVVTLPQTVSIPTSGPMKLVHVSNAAARLAVCNDGTPAAYYIRRGQKSTSWVLHLQGGGFCTDKQSCKQRQTEEPELMTTKFATDTRAGSGIQSTSSDKNPDFAEFNHVFIAYCSSDLWSGDRGASFETGGLQFRGARIFKAVVEDLMNTSIISSPNLSDAQQVIFSGTSAGGAGVSVHLDRLTEMLPNAQVRGINDAGWFVDVQPYNTSLTPFRQQTQNAYRFWKGTADAGCLAANPGREGLCYMGPYVFPHLTTPLFVQIAQFDGPQLLAQGIQPPEDQSELAYARQFAQTVRQSLEAVPAAFSPADKTHGLLTNDKFWLLKVKEATLRDALHNWIFSGVSSIKLIAN